MTKRMPKNPRAKRRRNESSFFFRAPGLQVSPACVGEKIKSRMKVYAPA
jgi:hypothetical protein